MTILETNSKNLNDKIQSFRDLNLTLIKGLTAVHGIDEISLVHKALELSNLYAWNAQIVNNEFIVPPKIEFSLTRRATFPLLEVMDNDVRLTLKILENIMELVGLMPELFSMLQDMDSIVCDECMEFSDAEFEIEEHKIETVCDSLSRTLDCLKDATMWSNLYLERKQS